MKIKKKINKFDRSSMNCFEVMRTKPQGPVENTPTPLIQFILDQTNVQTVHL